MESRLEEAVMIKEDSKKDFLDFLDRKIKEFGGEGSREEILEFADKIYTFLNKNETKKRESLKEVVKFNKTFSLFELLDMARRDDREIEILNFYRGVPIRSRAEILEFEDDMVVLKTLNIQLMAMKIQKRAFILKGDIFPQNLRGEVDTVNFLNGTVILKNLRYYFDTSFYKRMDDLRVEPKYPLYINCIKEFSRYEAWIVEISKNRISFITKSGELERGDLVNIHPLFWEDEELAFKLKIEERYFYEGYFHYSGEMDAEKKIEERFYDLIEKIKKEAQTELKEELAYYVA